MERKYSPRRRDFVAYFDERDGKGLIKGTDNSTLHHMMKSKRVQLANAVKWTTERNLY